MSRSSKALVGVLVVVVLLVGGAVVYLGPIAPVATGYAAKITCSGHHVSGRPVAEVQQDLPSNPLVPLLRTDVGQNHVRTTLLGAWGSTAWYTPGHGCTLAEESPVLSVLSRVTHDDPGAPWPAGDGPVRDADDGNDEGDGTDEGDGVDRAGIDAALDAAFSEQDLVGDPDGRRRGTRAVVVVHGGELVAERYADGFDAATPLLGWSMGKSIANAVMGRIAHERDDVDGVLARRDLRAEWADDARVDITVEHLLTMTTGLEFEEVYDPGTDATRMLFTPRDTAAFAADKPLVAEPGTRQSYSSGTTNILCGVAQDMTGMDDNMVHDLVFVPLRMTSAVLEPDAAGSPVCSSFPYATARDWARFGQWYLDDGVWEGERLLPEGWVEHATTPVQVEGIEHGYGAHWWLNDRGDGTLRMPDVPADAYWASGTEGQQVVVIPSADVVVVRLGLSSGFSGVEWGLEPLLRGVLDAVQGA